MASSVLIIIIFLVPAFLSFRSQILQPTSVYRSWDSVNVLLVVFAFLCGLFARRNVEISSSNDAEGRWNSETVSNISAFDGRGSGSKSVSDGDWLDFRDPMIGGVESTGGGSRRSISSYPYPRQSWSESSGNDKFKFLDDPDVYFHQTPENFSRPARPNHEEAEEEVVGSRRYPIRETQVNKFVIIDSIPPLAKLSESEPVLPPPPPPPPPPAVRRRRSPHSFSKNERAARRLNEAESDKNKSVSISTPAAPSPPPPPPLPELPHVNRRNEEIRRKKSSATTEFATAIVSSYQAAAKKRSISKGIHESSAQNSSRLPSAPAPPPPPPPREVSRSVAKKSTKRNRHEIADQKYHPQAAAQPPPPPPPPPFKVLHSIFKKTMKSKRVNFTPTTAQPPPPPPLPNFVYNSIFKPGSKSKRIQRTIARLPPPDPPPLPPSSVFDSSLKSAPKTRLFEKTETLLHPPAPPPPPKTQQAHRLSNYNHKPLKQTKPISSHHENVTIAPPSPMIPLAPPPPPLPFLISAKKFVPKGDFVLIRRLSSGCSSSGLEDFDVMWEGGDSIGPDSIGPSTSCPSPDVNVKADTFISRLRGEWRLENTHSISM